ncbi:ATP-binding protein [Acinetobacter sp. B51(2017)]|uniref:ATP-binding protein n=1 Tax=Acinetobacter sp. B51(2017) TaxID=2060938 RepID=UPI000F0941EC|nr:ATP-binding protein [Acinetobacter sp. B51(2017)]
MNQRSLKKRLVISLLVVFVSLWSLVFIWLYIDLKQRLQDTLDQRLLASAQMVARLLQQLPLHHFEAALETQQQSNDPQHLIACEVSLLSADVALGQHIIAKTRGAPPTLSQQNLGFSTWSQHGVKWRSYVLRKGDIQVVAAERLVLRDALLQQILRSVLIPLLLSLFVCIGLIILIIRKEFLPLDQMSEHLSHPKLSLQDINSYLSQIDPKTVPQEVKPFVDNSIQLIQRLSSSLVQEQAFSAYAAHELRSPLTAIKTNLQLAVMMTKQQDIAENIQHHLQQADESIRRYAALLEQLLLLTQSENSVTHPSHAEPVVPLLEHVQATLETYYPQIRQMLWVDWQSLDSLNLPAMVIFTLLKNLIENALLHAQATQISIFMQEHKLIILDNGTALQPEDLACLGQRFWRKSSEQAGHGLGLALVQALCKQYHYQILFAVNKPSGLRVEIFAQQCLDGAE